MAEVGAAVNGWAAAEGSIARASCNSVLVDFGGDLDSDTSLAVIAGETFDAPGVSMVANRSEAGAKLLSPS